MMITIIVGIFVSVVNIYAKYHKLRKVSLKHLSWRNVFIGYILLDVCVLGDLRINTQVTLSTAHTNVEKYISDE